jgi:trimeric autotransporter adhesin
VNVSQLNNALVAVGASNAAQLDTVAAAFGGGVSLDINGLLGTPNYAIQGASYYNVGDGFAALDASITTLNGAISTLTSRVVTLESTPGLGLPVGTGSGLALGNGSNATDTTDTAFGHGADVGADSGTAIGSGATIATVATDAVAIGAGSNVTAASGTAIGQGASATATGAVAIGQGSVADQANTVSVGSVGNERRVTNVATGTATTDAANVGQVQAGDAATLASANAHTNATATQTLQSANTYTDSRMQAFSDQFTQLQDDVGNRLRHQDERIDQQGAMNAAMVNMAINAANSRSDKGRLGMGAGWQNGEGAVSVGYSKKIGERASFSLGGAFSSDDSSAGVGFGIDL